jgi:pimeloyl-ACP methyl ester carboxylesterase
MSPTEQEDAMSSQPSADSSPQKNDSSTPAARTSIVLVHGAFADGSSWRKVIPLLQATGLRVAAVQNPLTSLTEDVEFTHCIIEAQPGPVVLVGHSWGGSVITQAGDHPKVEALVYVAAFAPDAGEAGVDLVKTFPSMPGKEGRITTPDGFQMLTPESVRDNFAQDLEAGDANLIAATQGAIRASAFDEKVSAAAWRDKPSWYIVSAEDRMINPDAQRELARRMGATTTTLQTSHVPMLSQPEQVVAVIVAAARAV